MRQGLFEMSIRGCEVYWLLCVLPGKMRAVSLHLCPQILLFRPMDKWWVPSSVWLVLLSVGHESF